MKRAIVSYPHGKGTIEIERQLMSTIEDMQEYFKQFPEHETKEVKSNFRRELRDKNVLAINPAGGWCSIGNSIKIVKEL